MNTEQLRAYAIAGVSSRIAALEDELTELRGVLSRLQSETAAPVTRDAASEPAPRPRRVRALPIRQELADVPEPAVIDEDGPEPARMLTRRGRLPREVAPAEPVPVLPPMPRLIKASAS